MVGVIIVMLTFVIPNFVSMFEDLESDLPFMTKAVLSMSDAVMNYWYIIIAVIAAIVVGYKMYVKTDAGRHSVDKLYLECFRLRQPVQALQEHLVHFFRQVCL